MKHLKHLLVASLAMFLAFVLAVPAFAADAKQIVIKLPADPAGNEYTYSVYKVFDATSDGKSDAISYKVMLSKADKDLPTGFVTDDAGNVIHGTKDADGKITPSDAKELTADEIKAIAAYVAEDDAVKTGSGTANADGTATVTITVGDYGYYYITTSTGSVVTIDSTNPGAEVKDKNTVPTVDKKITGASSIDQAGKDAIAQVGTEVTYTATITVGNGSKNLKFHDAMGAGLELVANSIKVNGVNANQYRIAETPDSGDTITISFDDGIAASTTITVTYKATVTSDALHTDPAKNTAKVSYGDESKYTSETSETKVYNAKVTVTKKAESEDGSALAGAGFVIKNSAGKYYQLARDKKFVSWVDSIDDATEYTSGSDGAVPAFTGLADGTYTLVEKTVPAGYNKAADSEFTIAKAGAEDLNLELTTTVVNKSGTELPSTGGMGTTILYIVGGALVIGGGVALIVKRRVASMEQ